MVKLKQIKKILTWLLESTNLEQNNRLENLENVKIRIIPKNMHQ